jgi:NAD(P)-dependent dehydrogenase (short-subunit alcohol dehydrogenase family)
LEVDIVIANAGVSPETGHENCCAWQVSRVDFDATLDINIKGVSNMIRHFVPIMIDNAKNQKNPCNKCFVAISPGLGRSPNPYHTAYCASKWAIEGMIKSLAMSLPE